jgi:hypothetical protein
MEAQVIVPRARAAIGPLCIVVRRATDLCVRELSRSARPQRRVRQRGLVKRLVRRDWVMIVTHAHEFRDAMPRMIRGA